MDKMCNKSEVEDLEKTISKAGETENVKGRSSPVFKCLSHTKVVRHLDSSDYDIPSYQVNQSVKSKTSSKYANETSESVLPFSPTFSPIPVTSSLQFEPPTIHSLGTVAKNLDKTCKNNPDVSKSSGIKNLKYDEIFKSLGMTDKDISWVSSMATPSPKQKPGTEFNTIEKATFFPEEKFQNIQPRALFSPTLDDDFGCHPIIFTSESEDNDEEEYKSNIRLSDVCATLKHLEVKSLDLGADNSVNKTISEKDYTISPIIRNKKKKSGSGKKKLKGLLVISPENKDKYEFSVGEHTKPLEGDKVNSNCGSSFLEDDSFQSMSFSVIDELCKTLVSEQSRNNTSDALKTLNCDKTITNYEEHNTTKKFYYSKAATDVYSVSTMDNLHSYAKALEECDKGNSSGSKIDQLLSEKGIVRFDILNKEASKTDATKRPHSEIFEEWDLCKEKKLRQVDDKNCGWENGKQYLSESQLNVSDGEIFRTVENLEKTLASQESKELQKLSGEESQGKINEQSKNEISELNYCEKESDIKEPGQHHLAVPFPAFTTASGAKISVSEKAMEKAKDFLLSCDENLDFDCEKIERDCLDKSDKQTEIPKAELKEINCFEEKISMKGFSAGSEKQIKVSTDSLKKVKIFVGKCENVEGTPEEDQVPCFDKIKEKTEEDFTCGFVTGSGKKIQVSSEAMEKAKTLMSEFDSDERDQIGGVKSAVGFKTGSGKKIQVSEKALEKAKALMVDCEKDQEDLWIETSKTASKKRIPAQPKAFQLGQSLKGKLTGIKQKLMKGFSASSSKQLLEKAVEKGKACLENDEEQPKENINTFKGFLTGSGKTITVSSEALEKAKTFMRKCDEELSESSDKLASEWFVESKSETFGNEKEEPESTKPCTSASSVNDVKMSSEDLKKLKESGNEFFKIGEEISGTSGKAIPQTKPCPLGFETAAGRKVTVSEKALTKAKELMNEWEHMKLEDWGNSSSAADDRKTSKNNLMEVKGNAEESESKITNASEKFETDDWDEIIPSWLHVYSTSPSIASERIELSPLVSHEDGKSSKPNREYIVKSPVLGSRDRFHGKRKKRKLQLEEEKKSPRKSDTSFVVPYKNVEKKTTAKRTLNLNLDFSVPFKKMKFLEEDVTLDVDVKKERARARQEQEITIKQKQKVKPSRGSHLSRKCSEKQMSWKEAVGGSSPEVYSDEFLRRFGVLEEILKINIENADSFRFKGEDFFGPNCTKNITGIPVGDECLLILDDNDRFGVEELKSAFLASPGVQPNLIPLGWVENHVKWINWKLVHYEKSFPGYFARKCLTPHHILVQLKYRYDREIDKNERSALKKILEKDDTSIKRLVLCVCGIKKVSVGESNSYELQLTDGWYSCPARSDPAMTRLIEEGKLCIGTKLMTQGAILVNCEQGVSPLEISGDVYLKISTNSTRRIRWDTKLGFQKNPKYFPISLGSILPQGGLIGRIDVIIVRVYPILFMEKTSDGHHVTRNRRSEEKAESAYRKIQEQRLETICVEIESEMRKSTSEKANNRNRLNDVEQVEDCSNSSAFHEFISGDRNFESNQNNRINLELREKINKKLEQEKLKKRNVSEFLRAKMVDFRKPDFNNPALLCVWNPSEDLTDLLSEGKVISLMNVTVSNSSRAYKPIQINTTRQTQYRQIVRNVKFPARKLTQLKDVSSKVCPAFEEVDVVGMVASIQDVSYGSRQSQIVYLTDLKMNFVGVVFWGSCKDFGWENVLKIPSVVACSNLQWKKNYIVQEVPSLYVNENSTFTENPKHSHLKEEIERLRQILPQDKTSFLTKCEEELTTKLEDSKWKTNISKNSSGNDSSLKDISKSRVVNGFESKPTASSTPIKPFSVRVGSDEAEPSPIQKRIEKLQNYGEPPSLIPLLVRKNAKGKFKKKC